VRQVRVATDWLYKTRAIGSGRRAHRAGATSRGLDPTTPATIEGATMSLAIGAPGIAQTMFHDDGGAGSQVGNAGQDAVIDKPRPYDDAPAGTQVGNAGQDAVIDKPRPYDDAPAGTQVGNGGQNAVIDKPTNPSGSMSGSSAAAGAGVWLRV
jgi:hypothetical protein